MAKSDEFENEDILDDDSIDDEDLIEDVLDDEEDVVEDVDDVSFDDVEDVDDEPFDDEGVLEDELGDEAEASADDGDDFDDVGDDDIGDGDRDEGDDFDEEDDFFEEEKPAAQTHMFTYILAFLNIVAAVGFAVLLVYDLEKRREWTYSAFLHDMSIQGLPLEEEKAGPSGSRFIGPKQRFTGEELQKVLQNRGGKSVSEKFLSVEEVFEYPIKPQHLNEGILKDWFQNIGTPVKTLEEEVHRVKTEDVPKIKQAAKDVVSNKLLDKTQKQNAIRYFLFPLAFAPVQIEQLEYAIKSTPDPDAMLEDAVRRRILYDILSILDYHRGSELKDKTLQQVVDFTPAPPDPKAPPPPPRTPKDYLVQLDQLEKLLDNRFAAAIADEYDPKLHYGDRPADPDKKQEEIRYAGMKRSSTEKRKTIATLLFTLGQTKLPGGDPKAPLKRNTDLVAHGLQRVEGVIGTYEYALAFGRMTLALNNQHEQYLDIIRTDRDGDTVFDATTQTYDRLPGFVDRYESLVKEILDVREAIKRHSAWMTEATAQKEELEQLYKDRVQQLNDITTKLIARRQETKKLFDELRELQKRLFAAQVRLADANETNIRLEQRIRELEYKLKSKVNKK